MKRLVDFILALVGFGLLSPVMVLVALAVRTRLGSPIFFKQQRPGLGGSPFIIYKFRTLTDQRDPSGQLLPDNLRMTALGAALRKWSLDELPELYNVLKGEMSLVGPRPLLMQYLERYTPEQRRRHEVLPGITGWAQINGRNAISWEEKFALDLWYVDHRSFGLDLKILVKTLAGVVKPQGISQEGHVTAREFMGEKQDG